jgi:hypothetical protein
VTNAGLHDLRKANNTKVVPIPVCPAAVLLEEPVPMNARACQHGRVGQGVDHIQIEVFALPNRMS